MSEALDSVKKEIAQLTEVIKSAGNDKATLDYDKLAEAVMKAQAAAQADKPVRRGEGVDVGNDEPTETIKGGKFDGMKADELVFANWLLGKAAEKGAAVKERSKEFKAAVAKTLTSTGSGTGDELVPTGMANTLWNDMFLDSRVAGAFGPAVSMPTDPWDYPLGLGDVTWRKGTQGTATTASDPATSKGTMTSTELITEVGLTYTLDEDSIIAVIPELRNVIGRNGAESIDRFIMNADSASGGTGNVNSDDAAPNADDYFMSDGQNGIRRQFIVDNTAQKSALGTAVTDAGMRTLLGLVGKYAGDINNLVYFTDPVTYISMMAMTNVVTVDKYGPQATVLTGELSKYGGVPIVVTPSMTRTDTDGKWTTTSPTTANVKGNIALVWRPAWKVGYRRSLLIEFDRFIQTRKLVLVASYRIAVASRGARASAIHTAGLINLT